jgi:phosphoglycerate dehydrogenase-like enzyme
MLPARNELTICFAHAAYQMKQCFDALNTGIANFELRDRAELDRRIADADVLVVSGMWHNGLIPHARRLRFIQSISAGTDQYDKSALQAAGIRLASAQGVNARAVAEHALALVLALARRLPEARDNQARHFWRGMIGDLTQREDELGGKTLLIVGLGRIGNRLAQLAKAFDMRVIGVRRDRSRGAGASDEIHALTDVPSLLPQADFVVLTCPLTDETRGLINARTLAAMKPGAFLVNVARGPCVDEPALIAALEQGRIAGAAVDLAAEEPLPATSRLWTARNVFITPHTAGETRKYEANVIGILMENLDRLWQGEAALRNQVV